MYSIHCRIKYRCAENSIHILCVSVSSGFHCKLMLMLSQVFMHLALLLIWASMWPIKVFDAYVISMCNWSRWVNITMGQSLHSIDIGLKISLLFKEVTYYSIDRLHKMKTMTTLNEVELRGCNPNQKYPICLGCRLEIPQTSITDSTSLLVHVKHFVQVSFNAILVSIQLSSLTKSRF